MKKCLYLIFAGIGALSGCTRFACTYHNDLDWKLFQSDHFIFYFRANSLAEHHIQRIVTEKEEGYRKIINTLNVCFNGIIHYYMYNQDEKKLIGAYGYANTSFETVYEVYDGSPTGCHETAHVIAEQAIGPGQTRMMIEGLAVALAGPSYYNYKLISEWMSEYKKANALIPVRELLADTGNYDEGSFYVQSGSFVNYLLEKYGSDRIKRIYTANRDDFMAVFNRVYGSDLSQVEAEYLQGIN